MNVARPAVRSRARDRSGYAILSALVITALVAIALAGLLSLAASGLSVAGSDGAALTARAAAEQGVETAREALRWGWVSAPATLRRPAQGHGSFEASIEEMDPGSLGGAIAFDPMPSEDGIAASCRRFWRVVSTGRCGSAVRRIDAVLVSRPGALPRGVVVDGDVSLAAGLVLLDCGLYAGGDVTSRELVRIATSQGDGDADAGQVPDLAYGGAYAYAAVHARGVIEREGVEVHDPPGTAEPGDDDRHTLGGPPIGLLAAPSWRLRAALSCHATAPGPALRDAELSLAMVPSRPAVHASATGPGTGHVLVIIADSPLTIVGDRDGGGGASAITLVVDGDCVLGSATDPGAAVSFHGALVVSGRLTVRGPTTIAGGVHAAALDVRAPLTVAVGAEADDLGQESAPGASNVQIAAWSE